ncbi:MAG: AHH domain-containing protein [Cyanobacteriota bacterium]|nr:AHH domain-containing protein [Cyanobacteriota bacterium]
MLENELWDNGHYPDDGDRVSITVTPLLNKQNGVTINSPYPQVETTQSSQLLWDQGTVANQPLQLRAVFSKIKIEVASEGTYPPATMGFQLLNSISPSSATVWSSLLGSDGQANQFIEFEVECRISPTNRLAQNIQQGSHLPEAPPPTFQPCDTQTHHIVEQNDLCAQQARDVLDSYQISIDDAVNGVFLPGRRESYAPGPYHQTVHTDKYIDTVNELLQIAKTNNKPVNEIVQILNGLRARLLNHDSTLWL